MALCLSLIGLAMKGRYPKVILPEEYKALEKGDLLKCDSFINNTIYLSFPLK